MLNQSGTTANTYLTSTNLLLALIELQLKICNYTAQKCENLDSFY